MAELRQQYYSGMALIRRGDKDRFALPSKFRNVVEATSQGRKLCVSGHPKLLCLTGYGTLHLEEKIAKVASNSERFEASDPDYDPEGAFAGVTASLDKLSFDASGRFIFPLEVRAIAGISDEALLIGTGQQFQIWDTDTLAELETDIVYLKHAQRALPVLRRAAEGKS